jgi:hypothetical protein
MKGDIIDVQQMEGVSDASGGAIASRTQVTVGAATPLRLVLTPTADCVWETYLHLGYMTIAEASWNYCYGEIQLDPQGGNPANIARSIGTNHATAPYVHRCVHTTWRLSAGITYRATTWVNPGGGTHSWWMAPEMTWILGIAYEL